MRIILLLSILLFISCSSNQKQIQKLHDSEISKAELSAKIQELIQSAEVTGLGISIFNENKVVYQNTFGFANIDEGDSLTSDMIFYGASFSKAVFGYLVSQLVTEGLINLDTPLQDYLEKPLPEIEFERDWRGFAALNEDKRYEKITARMCLTHTTGFPNWRWMSKDSDFFPEGKIRFLIDPSTRYSYSGEGINLLQFVIEKITNKGLEELAQERIFEPLGMHLTSYVWQDRFKNIYCNGHTTSQEVIAKDTEDEANAAGSMETTLEDYSKFIQEILRQCEERSNVTKLLFEPTVRITSKVQFGFQSWEDTDENDAIELSYGLGWGLLKSPYGFGAFKEGHGEGFQHYSIIFPEAGIGIIIMSNSDNAESIFKELLEITIGDTFTPWKWERYIPYDLAG